MNKLGWMMTMVVCLGWSLVQAEESNADLSESPGAIPELSGIEFGFGITQIYQQNVHGGLRISDRSGRITGSYDLEMDVDAERLFRIEGGRIYMLVEGSWPRAEGINEESVGSFLGINDDAGGCRPIDVTELWWEHSLLDGGLQVRLGKMDLTNTCLCKGMPAAFDGNRYANCECEQFLASPLVNNAAIPFPDFGLGMSFHFEVEQGWYVTAACVDAQADTRETGFNTTFHDEDYLFGIVETGWITAIETSSGPLPGGYRVGTWYDPQDKERFSTGGIKRDDVGFYMNFDQQIWRENSDAEDEQGLGVFGRYGWSSSDVEPELTHFWSMGLSWQGLAPNRDDDVLAIGMAQGVFSDQFEASCDHETVCECHYRICVCECCQVTPLVQYVAGTAGEESASDALIMGLRVQMFF